MKHIIAGLTFSIVLASANASDLFDTVDYQPFLSDPILTGSQIFDEWEPSPHEASTSGNGELMIGLNDDCHSDADVDDIFLPSDIARVRPRGDACLQPLPPALPYIDIYDSNGMLNMMSPVPVPKIPDTENDNNILRLEEQFKLPSFSPTPDTNHDEQDDICPKHIAGKANIPVCDSGEPGRNVLRLPRDDHSTVYNVRPC
jgi:hypothetical protein